MATKKSKLLHYSPRKSLEKGGMWSNIKRLTGKKPSFTIPFLTIDNQTFTTRSDICEKMAVYFATASSNFNYDPNFLYKK